MSSLVRRVLLTQSRRLSCTAKCNDRSTRKLEKVEEIDDQFHLLPLGKSDVNVQTRVSLLSKDMEAEDKICVSTISSYGFRLLNSEFMYGPIAVFPKTVLSWRVLTVDDITPASLELFLLLQPKLDLLIIGAGDRKNVDKVNARVAPTLKEHNIAYEVLSTEFAIPTFNFLNNDGRFVAAALFPPQDLIITQYQHGQAMQMVRSFDENELCIPLMGHNLSPDQYDSLMNIFYEGEPGEEREAGKKRIMEIRKEKHEERQKYFAERRQRATEEQILSLAEAKENLRKLEEERERAKKLPGKSGSDEGNKD